MKELRCKGTLFNKYTGEKQKCSRLLAMVREDGKLEIKWSKLVVIANQEAEITCPRCGTVNAKGE